MNSLKFLSLVLLFSSLLIACGGDDDGPSSNIDCNSSLAVNQAISDEVDAISNAVTAFANDPSSSNCDALKDAYRDYIDALKDLQDCADQAGSGSDFLLALSNAENSIDGLIC